MRSTNIADLRNRLTQYLQEVRAGEEIIVRDRQKPIAKIVPFAVGDNDDDAALVAAGLMRKGTGKLPASFGGRGAHVCRSRPQSQPCPLIAMRIEWQRPLVCFDERLS